MTQSKLADELLCEALRNRAELLQGIRQFFITRKVLEVDTPILSPSTTTDPFIESFRSRYEPLFSPAPEGVSELFLHTSPEFYMKRLLAAGAGDIYQICKVFRQGEISRLHNPEFTLIEWYRADMGYKALMQEVAELIQELASPEQLSDHVRKYTYRELFERYFGFDPHDVTREALQEALAKFIPGALLEQDEAKDRYLELLFTHVIEPKLGFADQGKACIDFVYDYPATQSALSALRQEPGYQVAQRFEVFVAGIELGNGFQELTDTVEQHSRFETDNTMRARNGQAVIPLDKGFLHALEKMPQGSGVAVGFERLQMVLYAREHIGDVIAFPFNRL